MMKSHVEPPIWNDADFICNVTASRPFLLLSDKNGISLGRSPIPLTRRIEMEV